MTFILCPECRKCLGDVAKFVEYARKGLMKTITENKFKDISPEKLELTDTGVNIGFILDLVGAKLICCRQHLLGMYEEDPLTYV